MNGVYVTYIVRPTIHLEVLLKRFHNSITFRYLCYIGRTSLFVRLQKIAHQLSIAIGLLFLILVVIVWNKTLGEDESPHIEVASALLFSLNS